MTSAVPSPAPPHVLTLDELEANPWASCGPASLAALLGRPLAEIRHAFPAQRQGRCWTNFRQMRDALDTLRVVARATKDDPLHDGAPGWAAKQWPSVGLAMIQWRGTWDSMPVNHPAQLQRTHWIAVRSDGWIKLDQPAVFDVNAVEAEALAQWSWWQPLSWWTQVVVPLLTAEHRKSTGEWWVRAGIEVAC